MKLATDTIGSHTGTGASTIIHKLGADGRSPAVDVGHVSRLVAISGTFSGTVKLEVSLDGTVYFDLLTGITSANAYVIEDFWPFLRSNCTAFASGTIVVTACKLVDD